ncbi:MAG: hypothetical protein JWM05_350 [Acidimicrobiales bacterium]|nr:hypothetical protein [Acidimicrobiales bacterium]
MTVTIQARHRRRAGVAVVAVVAALVALTGCYPTTVAPPPGAAPLRYRDPVFSSVSITRDLSYGSAPDRQGKAVDLKLDLYQPTGDQARARPVLIWAHGGSFCCGDKGGGIPPLIGDAFAKRGYVVASINYRLLATTGCGGGVTPDCSSAAIEAVHDHQAAVRWLRSKATTYRIDPNRISTGGESAGAITATGTGLMADQPGSSGTPGVSSKVQAWVSLSGGLPNGLFVDSTDAPGYLFSGTADTTVPYIWSTQTAQAMVAAGVPVVFKTFVGAGHVPWDHSTEIISQTANFLYQRLDLAHAAK